MLIDEQSLDVRTGPIPEERDQFHACTSEVMGGCNKHHEWNRIKYPNSSSGVVCNGPVEQHLHEQPISTCTPSNSTPSSSQLNAKSNLKRKMGECRSIDHEADSPRSKVFKETNGEGIGKGESVGCEAATNEANLRELDDEELNSIFDESAGASV